MVLAGKIALVTGAGRGIGRGCGLELARAGADIVLNDRPGSTELEEAADEIRQLGRRCLTVAADVFSREGCQQVLDRALEHFQKIDILISNPAFSRRGAFLDYNPELFEQTIRGTLTSGFHMSQLVARHMVEASLAGRIVFISSIQAEMPYGLSVAYNAAKAGLNHMARTIAVELSQYRINVNVIEPGWTDTPGERIAFGESMIVEEGRKLPLGRLATPEDIGRAATFLVSENADYITGATLPVDGGFWFKECRPTAAIVPNKQA